MKPVSKKLNILFRVAGIFYGMILIYVLFLRSMGHDNSLTYMEYLKCRSNFIPFISVYNLVTTPFISTSTVLIFLINFIGNIFLFIPWGFLLPLYFKSLCTFRNFIRTTLITVLLIESIQLFARLGSFDIEDILLNAVGACIGFLCCKKLFFAEIQK